jgi:hypothetical protein
MEFSALGEAMPAPSRAIEISVSSKNHSALVQEVSVVKGTTWLANVIGERKPPLPLLHAFVIVVFLIALGVQILVCTGAVKSFPKPNLFSKKSSCKKSSTRSFVQQISVSSVSDVETYRSSATIPAGRLVRLEVKIEGTFDRNPIQAPLTQRNCVMYSANATCQGESMAAARDSKQSDFIVSLVDAPWVKVLVASSDVSCFDMRSGLWHHSERLVDAPEALKVFVVENMNPDCLAESPSSDRDAKRIDFEETSLLVGGVVTLVGLLRPSPGGQLVLQTRQENDDVVDADSSWTGKVLASDDSSLHRRRASGDSQSAAK